MAARDAQGRFTRLHDGLANVASGAGTSVDKRAYAGYVQTYINPTEIEAAYRTSWLTKKLIDLPPFDMTREGRDWQTDKEAVKAIESEEKRLGLWDKLRQALVLGRLGGGVIVMGVGTEDPALPINPRSLGKGSLRYLAVFNRWQINVGAMVLDPADPLFGQPAYFEIGSGGGKLRLHPSRVVAFRGRQVPALTGMGGVDWFWGDPELMSVKDAVQNADAAMNGFASLIEEAKVDTVTIPGLSDRVATAEGEALVQKRISVANLMKSNHNTRILDGGRDKDSPGESWETRQVSWGGMPGVIQTYLSIVAGAADIPATRLLGKSPDGLNATGASDLANYDAMILSRQEAYLRPALDQIDAALLPSAGVDVPDAYYDFPPLTQLSELDEATAFMNTVTAVSHLASTGLVPSIALEKGLQNLMAERGYLPGLDAALAELPEEQRFPSLVAGDQTDDPSAIQTSNGGKAGDLSLAPGGEDGSQAARRRAANDVLIAAGIEADKIAAILDAALPENG